MVALSLFPQTIFRFSLGCFLEAKTYLEKGGFMKMLIKSILLTGFFVTVSQAFAQGQLMTWIQSSGASTSLTNVLSTNQVMEILSTSTDSSSQIDVTVANQTVSFGGTGNLAQPTPFVVAGPATVIFRRTASGGSGGLITYRVSQTAVKTP
jgi:hypothetical protein